MPCGVPIDEHSRPFDHPALSTEFEAHQALALMGKIDAIQALELSLSQDSATPTLGGPDRQTYLSEQRARLRSCIIEPTPVVARAGEWAQKYCGLTAEPYNMIAVAFSPGTVGCCLLYNPATGMFSLAYGHIHDVAGLDLVGYSSTDALAEWLG